jgi:hypothetical protein
MSPTADSIPTMLLPGKVRRSRRADLHEIEEALWAAYRRYDRSAVMQKLVQRHLRLGRHRARSRAV